MAKKYHEKEVAQWTVNDMLAYVADEHQRRFNVDYQPFGTWASERGQLGNWIGTRKKAGKYGAEFTKRFIDLCMRTYTPRKPGDSWSFVFMATHMKYNIKTVQLEMMRAEAAADSQAEEVDEDWL
jgi:hypothetical protein